MIWALRISSALLFFVLIAEGFSYASELVKTADLAPTQFEVGYYEVAIKEERILKAIIDKEELEELLKDQTGLAVKGPKGIYALLDRHHFAFAAYRAGLKEIRVDVAEDWSELRVEEFWKRLERKGRLWLLDKNGHKREAKELPRTIAQLEDDPYRSLAYLVRKAGGYKKKKKTLFQDSYWARFFRTYIPPFNINRKVERKTALKLAIELSQSKQASDLPGYIGNGASCEALLATPL